MTAPKRPVRSADESPASEPNAPSFGDLLSRSLQVGYRALDDYVQQGQRLAERVDGGFPSRDAVGSNVQDLGVRMLRHASDLLDAWLDTLGRPEAQRATPVEAARRDPVDTVDRSAPNVDARRLRLRIASRRPVESSLELHAGPLPKRITAREFRSPDATSAALTILMNEDAAGIPSLAIVVPEAFPAGTYDVLLLDGSDDTPCGALRLTIG